MTSTRKEVSEKHRKAAADIMDQSCLPEALVKNGVDKCLRIDIAAALAKVERDTFKRAAEKAKPSGNRPCDCDRCDCGNVGDLEAVAAWDQQDALYRAIISESGEA